MLFVLLSKRFLHMTVLDGFAFVAIHANLLDRYNEQVHQIVDELLIKLDESAVHDPEPEHLNNEIPQQSSPENKVTLTVSEAAELIGISKPSMYEVVRTGKVRSVKVGKKILISRQSLMDWLKKGETYGAEAC